jgi:hypothetical protein
LIFFNTGSITGNKAGIEPRASPFTQPVHSQSNTTRPKYRYQKFKQEASLQKEVSYHFQYNIEVSWKLQYAAIGALDCKKWQKRSFVGAVGDITH